MASTVVGDKGRVILPVAVRSEAGVDIGDELIVRSIAPGQIVLETRDVVVRRLRSRFANGGGTKELHEARALDNEIDTRRARSAAPPGRSADLDADTRRADAILAALDAPPARRTKAS